MSIATYRGVKYNTEIPKEEYRKWYLQTHAPSRKLNIYRGITYRPCRNQEVSK